MTLAFLLALAAAQQGMAGEEAIAAQQSLVRDVVEQRCPPGAESDAIIVCGRREPIQRYRVPFAEEGRTAGVRDQAGGEQRAALAVDSSRCTTVGRDPDCGFVNLLGIGINIVREVVAGLERRRD